MLCGDIFNNFQLLSWSDPFALTCIIRYCVPGTQVSRYVNPNLGAEGKADKCSFCVERTALGLAPACVQTCLAGARIFGDLNDPASEVAKYVRKGAIRLESDAVKIGPNVRYFGKKRDLLLLAASCAPKVMPQASLRRIWLARIFRPVLPGAKKESFFDFIG
ncbi:MAG: hypothetical protein HGA96_05475 [Desulfobulbaceae bacterium]|nr:hypothetical protein [Desulfobulbaceae bacterium]